MSRALVSVMLFVMMVSSTFLTIGIGTQNTYPVQFLDMASIIAMDSNASPQHFFATYVAGRVIEMNAGQLPFLQNIDPRYLHVLIYDGEEFIEIPVRIYTKVIHFNPGSSLSGKLYVVPKKMSSNTVIDIKLPPIYPKSLDAEALNRLPIYLKGSILYPTTIAIRLENGREVSFPIIFAIAKVRNIEIAKNSIDYDNVVEDFELYGVGGFYQKLLELVRKGIAVDIRRTIEQYTNTVLKAGIESIEQPIDLSNENVPQWNVVEFVAPFKTWSINCTNYPCTIYPWFKYLPKHPYPGTLTELIVYRINVKPLENQGGSPPGSTPTSTPTVTSSYTTVTTSSTFSTTHSTTFTSTSSRSVTSTTSRSTSTSVTSTTLTSSTTIRTSTTTHPTTITSPTSTTHTTSTTTMITTRPSFTKIKPSPPTPPEPWRSIVSLGRSFNPTNETIETTPITTQLCKLVVNYYANGSWYQQTYYIDPNTNNLIWFEWYFPETDDNVSRVNVTLEECAEPMTLEIESVAVAHYIPNVENSVLSNKTLDLYPLGTPNTSYYIYPDNVPLYIGAGEYITLELPLPIPLLQALLEKFVSGNELVDSYTIEFLFDVHTLNEINGTSASAEIQICIGTACSDVVDVGEGEMNFVEIELTPQDILSYFEALRNLPITISIWNLCDVPIDVSIVEQIGIPIRMAARPMRMYYTADGSLYSCTTAYPDTSNAWTSPQYQVRGSYEASYIIRSAPLPNRIGGFVIRSSFSPKTEIPQGFILTENIKIGFIYHAFGPEKPSLYSVTTDIYNPGLGSVTGVQILVYGLMEGEYPLAECIPLILSLILTVLNLPEPFNALYKGIQTIYTVWTIYIKYIASSYSNYLVSPDHIHVDYVPPPVYGGVAYDVHFEIKLIDATILEQYEYRVFHVSQIINVDHRYGCINSIVNATYVVSLIPETSS